MGMKKINTTSYISKRDTTWYGLLKGLANLYALTSCSDGIWIINLP